MLIKAGQVAVVTGGTSGIGFGLADRLSSRGVDVMFADIRDDAIPPAVTALSGRPGRVAGTRVDVRVDADMAALAQATLDRFGRVDLLCNNAGVVCEPAPTWEQRLETWRWLIDVKLMGVVNGVRAFAPLLIGQGRGHVLNTASFGGLAPLPARAPYNATMHAVVGLTETLHLELREVSPELGATVLCPGLVNTALGANSAALVPRGAASTPEDSGVITGGIEPAAVADAAIEAVEAGRVHAIVGPGARTVVRGRVDALLADLG